MVNITEKSAILLLISHVVPQPPAAGNEIRILKMVNWLKRQGIGIVLLLNHAPLSAERMTLLESTVDRVHFIDDDFGTELPAVRRPLLASLQQKLAQALPDSTLYRALFDMGKAEKIRSNSVKRYLACERLIQVTRHLCGVYNPSVVMAEYIFAAPCLDVVPEGVLKIIDTHDIFSRKKEQVLAYGIDDPLPCSSREERAHLLKSDLVIAIQSNEARMFRELVKERDVVTVGIDFEAVQGIDNREVVAGRILVVGSDNPLNVHGLNEFYVNAWPVIREARSEVVLRVVGKLANQLEIDDERVQLVGWVADLEREYRQAALVINPTLAGTGLKIKSVEALCQAKALVGTPNSVEGIDHVGEPPFLVGYDWQQFADAVLTLLQSEQQRLQLQDLAWRFARKHFSTEKVYSPLGRKLQEHLQICRGAAV